MVVDRCECQEPGVEVVGLEKIDHSEDRRDLPRLRGRAHDVKRVPVLHAWWKTLDCCRQGKAMLRDERSIRILVNHVRTGLDLQLEERSECAIGVIASELPQTFRM